MAPGKVSGLRSASEYRVVSHHPLRRALMVVAVAGICALGVFGGYWFGGAESELDSSYVDSLESLKRANAAELKTLKGALVEAGLAREVDRQAAEELRESIRALRNEVAALQEEVTFYKSLMAPSTVAKGLQIAEFDLSKAGAERQFLYHILLTQVESRRDWIQGEVRLEVFGMPPGAEVEQVLPFTELAGTEPYPLKFRFRYFQDLSGLVTLPAGFQPTRVVVVARKRGGGNVDVSRTFGWTASG
ncbi:MAG: DUF6776 family protein [Pseudomonadales bacterium]|nr:hypothetical protein [Pseudomonadales bacterium]